MKLLKWGFALLPLTLFLSCTGKFVENEAGKRLEEDIEEIKAYVEANNIDVQKVESGIFWKKWVEDSTAAVPQVGEFLHLAYRISNLRGTELVEKTAEDSIFFFSSSNVFSGFIAALNSLREGEKGIYYIPSIYAYADMPPEGFDLMKWEPIVLELELVKIYDEKGIIDVYIQRTGHTNVEKTDKGLRILRNLPRPDTEALAKGDSVEVKFKGYFLDEKKTEFDSGKFLHIVGRGGLIEGFEEALTHMRHGEKATVIIPSELAYGEQGSERVPPNTPLAFDIELLEPSGN